MKYGSLIIIPSMCSVIYIEYRLGTDYVPVASSHKILQVMRYIEPIIFINLLHVSVTELPQKDEKIVPKESDTKSLI